MEQIPHDPRLLRLLNVLPPRVRHGYEWLILPRNWWLRWPLGIALMLGGVFSFLPILGLWMLPLGALLIGEDIPPIRRAALWVLGWVQARWDSWRTRR